MIPKNPNTILPCHPKFFFNTLLDLVVLEDCFITFCIIYTVDSLRKQQHCPSPAPSSSPTLWAPMYVALTSLTSFNHPYFSDLFHLFLSLLLPLSLILFFHFILFLFISSLFSKKQKLTIRIGWSLRKLGKEGIVHQHCFLACIEGMLYWYTNSSFSMWFLFFFISFHFFRLCFYFYCSSPPFFCYFSYSFS